MFGGMVDYESIATYNMMTIPCMCYFENAFVTNEYYVIGSKIMKYIGGKKWVLNDKVGQSENYMFVLQLNVINDKPMSTLYYSSMFPEWSTKDYKPSSRSSEEVLKIILNSWQNIQSILHSTFFDTMYAQQEIDSIQSDYIEALNKFVSELIVKMACNKFDKLGDRVGYVRNVCTSVDLNVIKDMAIDSLVDIELKKRKSNVICEALFSVGMNPEFVMCKKRLLREFNNLSGAMW